jgi:hypothetical protein
MVDDSSWTRLRVDVMFSKSLITVGAFASNFVIPAKAENHFISSA